MRILVVGAGSVGGYFGGRLAEIGRDVAFLVRPKRAEQLQASGLQIVSPHGGATLHPKLVTAPEIDRPYDVVLLTVKAFALEAALEDVERAVGPATMIVPVLNGMRHLDILTERFGQAPVLGGVCKVAAMLDDEGRIIQLTGLQELSYGERDGSASERVTALHAEMQGASFEAVASRTIIWDMWQKWIMLATVGGVTCLMRGTIGEVEAAPGGAGFARRFLAECAAVAVASGQPPVPAYLAQVEATVTAPGSDFASSMYRDLQQGHDVEADQILGDLLGRAAALGVDAPLIGAAFTHLSLYRRKLRAGG